MRIVLVTRRVGPGTGTAGQAFLLARELEKLGHDVVVGGSAPSGARAVGLDRVPGCEVVRASGGVHRAWSRRRSITLGRWMAAHTPAQLLEARRDRAAVRSARRVICNSVRAAGEVVAWHGVPAARVRVVRNGVDLERFRPDAGRRSAARRAWGVPAAGRVALFLGHGWFRKGLDAAVVAFHGASGPADRLVVMGREEHAAPYLRRARERLGERLVVVPAGDPAPALPGADVLLHPTRYDASANAVLEALACGVPPVTTLCDGAAELVDDRALVVGDAADVQGLVAAVRRAWDGGPANRERCRALAEAWPGSRMAAAVLGVLEELDG